MPPQELDSTSIDFEAAVSDGQILKTVSNAIDLLEILAEMEEKPTLTQLTELMQLSKPSVHRLLITLKQRGYVQKDPQTRGYRLGLKLWQLGWIAVDRQEIRQVAHPLLVQMAEELDETVLLAVLSQSDRVSVYIDKVDPPRPITLFSRIGGTAPLHATSTGKIMLAYQDAAFLREYLSEPLPKFNRYTITDPEKLRAELELVRHRGWSQNIDGWREGTSSISAPIWGATGEFLAAVAVSMLTRHMQETTPESIATIVQNYAAQISTNLGYFNGVSEHRSSDRHKRVKQA